VLVRLTSDQISRFYDDIEAGVRAAVPPVAGEAPEAIQNVMESMIMGLMEVWMLCEAKEEGPPEVYAMAVTRRCEDVCSRTVTLLIYALYGYSLIPEHIWQDGLDTLRKYARSIGASHIGGFTSAHRIRDVAKQLGGNVDTWYIKLEV